MIFTAHQPSILRPREKIAQHGVETLTTTEVLSVILGKGSGRIPLSTLVSRIQEKLLSSHPIHLSDLLTVKGLGLAKACQIIAAIELVERLRPSGYPVVDSLEKALTHLNELRYAQREQIICLYLNARMQLVLKETLAMGSVNQAVLHPRDIFSVLKHHPVSFVILAHNHPSGTAVPSVEDQNFTHVIWQAGAILGVEVLDHIIVAKEEHYSCKEQGVFETFTLPLLSPASTTL